MVATPMTEGLFSLDVNALSARKNGPSSSSKLTQGEQTYSAQHEFTPNASSDSLFTPKAGAAQSIAQNTSANTSRLASTLRFVSSFFAAAEGSEDETCLNAQQGKPDDIKSSTVSMYKSVTIRPLDASVRNDEFCRDDVFQSRKPNVDTDLRSLLYRFSAGEKVTSQINTISSGSCSDVLDRLSFQQQSAKAHRPYKAPNRRSVKSRPRGISGSNPSRSPHEHAKQRADRELDVKVMRRFFMSVKYTPTFRVKQYLLTVDEIEIRRAVEDGDLKEMRHLIQDRNISVELNGKFQPLLCIAVQNDSLAIVEELLLHGANPNSVWQEKTCVYMAYRAGRLDMMKKLLECGAVPEVANCKSKYKTAKSPLLYKAVEEGNVQAVKLLLPFTACVNMSRGERSIVHVAASTGSCEMMQVLHKGAAKKGENLDYNEKYCDETLLIQATRSGHIGLLKFLLEGDKVAVNSTDESGRTALHHAAAVSNDPQSVQLLLDAGADTRILDHNGRTALRWAEIHEHDSVVDLLNRTEISFPEVSLKMLARHAVKKSMSEADRHTVCASLPSEIANFVLKPLHEQLLF